MGLLLTIFATAFNALLWVGRVALAPVVAARAGSTAGWLIAAVGPSALLGIAIRLRAARTESLVFVASASFAVTSILASR